MCVCVQYTVTEGTGESLQGCTLNTLHCSTAHHDSDRQEKRERDNNVETGTKQAAQKKGGRQKRQKFPWKFVHCPWNAAKPANNTCIHHSLVLFIHLSALPAYLEVWILHFLSVTVHFEWDLLVYIKEVTRLTA